MHISQILVYIWEIKETNVFKIVYETFIVGSEG